MSGSKRKPSLTKLQRTKVGIEAAWTTIGELNNWIDYWKKPVHGKSPYSYAKVKSYQLARDAVLAHVQHLESMLAVYERIETASPSPPGRKPRIVHTNYFGLDRDKETTQLDV